MITINNRLIKLSIKEIKFLIINYVNEKVYLQSSLIIISIDFYKV
jgi:hypothetical protein